MPGETSAADAAPRRRLRLRDVAGAYAVCRLPPAAAFPAWADGAGFVSISRTAGELSIVCRAERVPAGVEADRGWACLEICGPFAFDETGIVAAAVVPLSGAGIGVFVVSTFDGDHLLVKADALAEAKHCLAAAGHRLDD